MHCRWLIAALLQLSVGCAIMASLQHRSVLFLLLFPTTEINADPERSSSPRISWRSHPDQLPLHAAVRVPRSSSRSG